MSVIIRLQNLPWSANAMDIRNFFRGLSIPEGGVHIVGGEQGDAFIAFSTDEDARQAMMNGGGKIKEVQVKLLLSSRSEMHKVIEAARQSVPLMQLTPQVLPVQQQQQPTLPPSLSGLFPHVLKVPNTTINTPANFAMGQMEPVPAPVEIISVDLSKDTRGRDSKSDRKGGRSRSRSRDRDKRRDKKRSRSRDRSRDRRRRDRSRSRDRSNRNRDRKDRSKDRNRSRESNDPRFGKDDKRVDNPIADMRNMNMPNAMNMNANLRGKEGLLGDYPLNGARAMGVQMPIAGMQGVRMPFNNPRPTPSVWAADSPMNQQNMMGMSNIIPNVRPKMPNQSRPTRFNDNNDMDEFNRLRELDERRNPNAFLAAENQMFGNRPIRPPFQEPNFRPNNGRMMNQNNMNNSEGMNYDNNDRYGHNVQNGGYSIKIQNLLSAVGYGDIRRFFAGNFISNQGLKIINNDSGKRSGVAYVRFFKYEGKLKALEKNGELLKGRPVVITSVDDDEFDNAIDSFRPMKEAEDSGDDGESNKNLVISEQDDDEYKVLVLEDLPAFAKEHDIMKMFSDYSLLSIFIVVTKDIRKQYVAYVQFVNADDAKAALNNKSKHIIGHKVIKVSPCSATTFEQVKANQNSLEEDVVESKNEPEQYDNVREDVSTSRDPRQRRFDRQEDVDDFAQSYGMSNQNSMNPRFPWRGGNNGNSMNQNNKRDSRGMRRPQMTHNNYHSPNMNTPVLDCLLMKGLPLQTTDRDILDFFADVNIIPTKTHLMLTVHGDPSGDCFCEFIDTEEAVNAASKHGALLNGNVIAVELVSRQVVDEARGVSDKNYMPRGFRGNRGFQRGPRRMRGGGYRGGGGRFSEHGESPMDGFNSPGCILSLENVPFRAEVDEILDFFSEYNLTQNDIIRRFNENGQPTGDVRVRLRTNMEAQRAIQDLNMRCIRDRKIKITPFTPL